MAPLSLNRNNDRAPAGSCTGRGQGDIWMIPHGDVFKLYNLSYKK